MRDRNERRAMSNYMCYQHPNIWKLNFLTSNLTIPLGIMVIGLWAFSIEFWLVLFVPFFANVLISFGTDTLYIHYYRKAQAGEDHA